MQIHTPVENDEFLTACAQAVRSAHGPNANQFTSAMIESLSEKLDMCAVETWQQIRKRLAQV